MFSFRMRQQLIIILVFYSFSPSACDGHVDYKGDADSALASCIKKNCFKITVPDVCLSADTMTDPRCVMNISSFSQADLNNVMTSLNQLQSRISCIGSDLSEINLQKLIVIGMPNISKKKNETTGSIHPLEIRNYPPSLVLLNNLNLRKLTLPELSKVNPSFFTIKNSPRLSRTSINTLNEQAGRAGPEIAERTEITPYGECNFHYYPVGSTKNSLSWEEFRWCRNVAHSVVLEGPKFNDTIVDAAYILEIQGTLTIRDTKLTDLRMFPVYFKMNNGVISNNLELCISFEDEIRMKRLGFTMEKNKPLDCRTNCQGGKLSLDKVRSLKNCLMIKGGLELENIDATTAAADLFKTVKRIEGPLVIRKAQVPVVFKKLETIQLTVTTDQPHIQIEHCTHPIVFNKQVKLQGDSTSTHMVVLKDAKANIYKHLNATYIGKVYDSVREQLKITTVADNAAPSVNLPVTPTIEKPGGAPATPVAMPVATNAENAEGITATPVVMPVAKENNVPPAERRSSRLPSGAYPPPGPNAAEISDANSYRGDLDNSSVDNKKTVLLVMTCASFVIFLASSVTSVGILLKFSIM